MWSTVVLPLIAGIVGWFATHFFARPLLKAYEYREKAHELIFYTANVLPEDGDRFQESVDELRRVAAQMDALLAVMPWYCRRLMVYLRIDLRRAASGLTGLSNSLGAKDGSKKVHRNHVEKDLNFHIT